MIQKGIAIHISIVNTISCQKSKEQTQKHQISVLNLIPVLIKTLAPNINLTSILINFYSIRTFKAQPLAQYCHNLGVTRDRVWTNEWVY
jgi:hypothetical protein